MNKDELISAIAEKTEFKKIDVKKTLDAFLETLQETLVAQDPLQLTGYFTISSVHREATKGRNPQTGQEITISARNQVKFSAGKVLKDAINATKEVKKKK